MKKAIFVLIVGLTGLVTTHAGFAICGNPETGSRKPKCNPCASPSPDPACAKGGTNHFDVYTGNVHRQITDLELYGGAGEYPLKFERTTTSRYLGGIPTPLGTSGSWRHNFLWNITYVGNNSIGNEIISIDYPDGENWRFDRKVSTDQYLTAVSQTEDQVEQSTTDSAQYYLIFPDGGKLSFRKISTSPIKYQIQSLIDPYGLVYSITVDTKGRVVTVTDPSGTRSINITYGSIGNFPTGNVTFTYANSTASTVSVAGEFNGWSTIANPMVNNNGTWTTTIPLQLAAAYQYKFVVNGSTWVSDPANWNTVPAGGPSTGNNSLVTNNDTGTTTGAVAVTFNYTNASASQVYVAGQFNNWSATANPLTKNGSNWSATLSLTQGSYQYKFVVDGNWIQDPTNAFTAPDGYGGYNSKLAVGPLDEGIVQVQANDGRFVTYSYTAAASGFAIYSSLVQVNYGDGSHASYSYTTPFTIGGRPILATADDPRYELGKAGSRIAYTYQNTGVDGFVYQEKSLVTGTVVATLGAPDETSRSVLEGNNGRTDYTFQNYQLVAKSTTGGTSGTTTYSDDGYGLPISITPVAGQTINLERTAAFGVVKKTTLPDGSYRSTTFTDESKPFFPASTRDENGNLTTYTRSDSTNPNRPTRIDYPDGSYETFTYNALGKVTNHRLRNGASESFTYMAPGLVDTKTDAAGKTTHFTYDAAGRVQTATDGRGNITAYSYNDRGQITQIVYNNDTTHARVFTYDPYGNKWSFRNEIGNTWNYTYDEYNRLLTATDPLHRQTAYSYGAGVGECTSCNSAASPTLITLPSGKQTKIVYDDDWRKTGVTVGFGTPEAATTHYAYNGMGNIISMTDPRGKIWSYSYDNRNRRTRATDPNLNYTEWTYDNLGNKLTEKRSGDAVAITYVYDSSNHLTDTTDQAGNHTHMTYDGAGNILTLVDPRSKTYSFTYDGMNRKLTIAYPGSGGTEAWTYDDAGNVATYTTRAGQTETFTYDNRNRETNASWSDAAPSVAKTYDAAGRLLTMTNNVSSLSYTYDDANQLLSETQQVLADGGPKAVTYTYDADGNRATIGYPSGSSVTLGYSNRNQLNSVSSGSITAAYTYDLNGNPTVKSLGNSTSVSYTYDDANRLTSLNNQKSGVSFAKYDYTYNTLNDSTGRTETVNTTAKLDSYQYDASDQIKTVKYNFNAGTNSQDRLVTYNYDAAGNRSGASGVSDSASGSTNYSVDDLNQYSAIGSLAPAYDTNGNMTGQDGWSYTYDAQNRLKSASTTGTTITFAYDGRNRCVSRTTNNVVTFFYYDAWNLIEEQNAANTVLARYIHGAKIDNIIAAVTPATTTYYHRDALGSTVALTDTSGNLVERYTYDVFGAPTVLNSLNISIPTSAVGNRFLFTGREYIQQTGLYDYRSRAYSPQFGRFLQTDGFRFAGRDVNLYRYVTNKVTRDTDPYGFMGHELNWWECTQTYTCEGKCCKPVTGTGYGATEDEAFKMADQNAANAIPKGCKAGSASHHCEFHWVYWYGHEPT